MSPEGTIVPGELNYDSVLSVFKFVISTNEYDCKHVIWKFLKIHQSQWNFLIYTEMIWVIFISNRPPSGHFYKISKDWHFHLEVFRPTYKEYIHNGKCYFTVRTNRVPQYKVWCCIIYAIQEMWTSVEFYNEWLSIPEMISTLT